MREKLATLACYREGISAHLTAAIAAWGRPSEWPPHAQPGAALHRPRAGLLAAAGDDPHRARALRRAALRHARRASFHLTEIGPWLEKYYNRRRGSVADDRRRLLAFARDLLNSDYAGHRLTFQLFAQSPAFAHLVAVYSNYDFDRPGRRCVARHDRCSPRAREPA